MDTIVTARDEMMKVSEAAEYLKISKASLYIMIQKKQIPYIRLSERRVIIRKSDLDRWLEARASY